MLWMYAGFVLLVLVLLALDLGVFHRRAHEVKMKEALGWSAFWIALGLAFTGVIYLGYERHWLGLGLTPDAMSNGAAVANGVYNDGSSAALKYITGYLVEKSLAVDNIFVIAMIFSAFAVPPRYQHRVLFWGILGALIMRGAMIAAGAALIRDFAWIIYVFGGFLILTGVKMLLLDSGPKDPRQNPVVRLARRILPVTDEHHGEKMFVRAGRTGKRMITPLFLALLMVELTDVVFAVDSIPAIFAITTDAFLVFTSNVFAMLGLRSLYFALAGMMGSFRYLKVALAFVLMVVGVKMMTHTWLKQLLGPSFNLILLAVVLGILATGVVASLLAKKGKDMQCPRCHDGVMEERERQGVTIDVCVRCRGVFLDRGELEKLLAIDDDRQAGGDDDDHDDDGGRREERHGKRRRRGGLLDVIGDLFD
jgi:tellurite resistance protein TerC